jgi:hypothetical protein
MAAFLVGAGFLPLALLQDIWCDRPRPVLDRCAGIALTVPEIRELDALVGFRSDRRFDKALRGAVSDAPTMSVAVSQKAPVVRCAITLGDVPNLVGASVYDAGSADDGRLDTSARLLFAVNDVRDGNWTGLIPAVAPEYSLAHAGSIRIRHQRQLVHFIAR